MRPRRSVMVVTNIFPPVSAVGVHRTVALCRRLAGRGDRVTVITARPEGRHMLDRGLLSRVPQGVRVVRTAAPDLLATAVRLVRGGGRAAGPSENAAAAGGGPRPSGQKKGLGRVADWLSRWLNVPDGYSGWFVPAVLTGLRLAHRDRPDVLYSSAPAWTGHLVGAALSHLLRVPWVADFRDPWCGSAFRGFPYAAHLWANRVLERMVVVGAGEITCAWDGIAQHLGATYPHRRDHICTILNGFDPELLGRSRPLRLDENRCVLLHAGSFYGPRSPIPLLKGLRHLREISRADAECLLVVLMGLTTFDGVPLDQLAARHGVAASVRVLPTVSHETALAYLKGADVALLFGQSGNASLASVPAKAYEYVGAGKPVLAIGAGAEVCQVMRRGGCRIWAVGETGEKAMAAALARVAADFRRGALATPAGPEARDAFTWMRTADRLGAVLDTAVGAPHAAGARSMPKRGT